MAPPSVPRPPSRDDDDLDDLLMPFGKYAGERVADLDRDYLCWLMTAEIRSPRLAQAIDRAHARYCKEHHAADEGPWR